MPGKKDYPRTWRPASESSEGPKRSAAKPTVRKPGPGSTQSEINAYIRQEVAKKTKTMPKTSSSSSATKSALAKVKPGTREKLMEKMKTSKPKPKLY